jgi:hypothetical protein
VTATYGDYQDRNRHHQAYKRLCGTEQTCRGRRRSMREWTARASTIETAGQRKGHSDEYQRYSRFQQRDNRCDVMFTALRHIPLNDHHRCADESRGELI